MQQTSKNAMPSIIQLAGCLFSPGGCGAIISRLPLINTANTSAKKHKAILAGPLVLSMLQPQIYSQQLRQWATEERYGHDTAPSVLYTLLDTSYSFRYTSCTFNNNYTNRPCGHRRSNGRQGCFAPRHSFTPRTYPRWLECVTLLLEKDLRRHGCTEVCMEEKWTSAEGFPRRL